MGIKKRLYRALPNRELKDVNFSNLGIHWTISPQFAEVWAKSTPNRDLKHIPEDSMHLINGRKEYRPKKAGVILEGEADLDYSVKDTDEDAEGIRKKYDIHPFEPSESGIGYMPPEREITLRFGSPISIRKAHEEVESPTDRHFKEGFVVKDINLFPETIASRTTHFDVGGKEGRV